MALMIGDCVTTRYIDTLIAMKQLLEA